MDFYWI